MAIGDGESDGDLEAARNRKVVRGCLIALLSPVAALILLFAWFEWDEPHGQLPSVVRTSEVLAFESAGFFREGSACGLYRLHPETIAGLRARGLAFLGTDTHPRKENESNRYAPWRETPLRFIDGDRVQLDPVRPPELLFSLHASGCRSGPPGNILTPQDRVEDVRRALAAPGSYFTVTGNGEGMIVVDPASGLAWFLYSG